MAPEKVEPVDLAAAEELRLKLAARYSVSDTEVLEEAARQMADVLFQPIVTEQGKRMVRHQDPALEPIVLRMLAAHGIVPVNDGTDSEGGFTEFAEAVVRAVKKLMLKRAGKELLTRGYGVTPKTE